ncbi:MAG: hypothetical protein HOO67_00750 [Candidatus Peribacteraceae bacterium]|nr:hypothetical protein [Candidatus Peribacteraceae bacterium]
MSKTKDNGGEVRFQNDGPPDGTYQMELKQPLVEFPSAPIIQNAHFRRSLGHLMIKEKPVKTPHPHASQAKEVLKRYSPKPKKLIRQRRERS